MEFLFGVVVGVLLSILALAASNSLTKKKPGKSQEVPAEPPAKISKIGVTVTVQERPYQHDSTPAYDAVDQDKDAWDGGHWEVTESFPVDVRLQITFRDISDRVTDRSITVRSVGDYAGEPALVAFCHLRNANRSFRLSRIQHCVDEDTGEIVENVYDYLFSRYSKSPDASIDLVLDEAFDAVKALFFIAKADGQMRKPEREVIARFFRDICKDDRVNEQMMKSLLSEWSVPSLQAYKIAVGKAGKLPDAVKGAFINAARDIVATGKNVTATEQDALDYIDKRIG